MNKLPNPKDPVGYTKQEISVILKALKITRKAFNGAFGINTIAIAKDGTPRFYRCDVESALHKLGHKLGKYHPWD